MGVKSYRNIHDNYSAIEFTGDNEKAVCRFIDDIDKDVLKRWRLSDFMKVGDVVICYGYQLRSYSGYQFSKNFIEV